MSPSKKILPFRSCGSSFFVSLLSSRPHPASKLARILLILVAFPSSGAGQTYEVFSFLDSATVEGSGPTAILIKASDGTLYGTTARGGSSDQGTIFKIDVGGTLTTLYSFSGPDGGGPVAALIVASDGSFYGTTSRGGSFDKGSIFRAAGVLTAIHSFNGEGWRENGRRGR